MPVDSSAPLRDIVEDYKTKNADEMYADLSSVPFFMQDYKEGEEENPQVEALRAMAYEGDPWEIALNFKNQGNDCFKVKKYPDAVAFYTQALEQHIGEDHEDITIACLGNRAQCNLELKNYRRCITDCLRTLDLQNDNLKAWFRSGKAFLSLKKPAECIACCDRGLGYDSANEQLLKLKSEAEHMQAEVERYAREREAREAARAERQLVLETARANRHLQFMYTATNYDNSNPGNFKMQLSDPKDPNSSLFLPVLALYPNAYESDVLESVEESATIEDIVDKLFTELPQWADPAKYAPANLECFVPTLSGGLARAGKQSTLAKIVATNNVVLVDNMVRIYMLPKEDVKEFAASWNKDAQTKMLKVGTPARD